MFGIVLFSKYAWVVLIKDKKGTSIVNTFQKESQSKENQIKYGLIKVVTFTIIPLKIFWNSSHIRVLIIKPFKK